MSLRSNSSSDDSLPNSIYFSWLEMLLSFCPNQLLLSASTRSDSECLDKSDSFSWIGERSAVCSMSVKDL